MQDKLFKVLLILSAIVIPVIGGGIIYSLTVDASGAFEEFGFWHFIFSDDWVTTAGKESYGALPFITGTLLTTALALLMCIPFSLPVALFTGEYFRGKKIAAVLGTVIDLLAGIPSIIYGMWGFFVFAPWFSENIQPWLIDHLGDVPYIGRLFQGAPMGIGLFTASLILAIMIIPFIASVMRDVFEIVPVMLKESAYGLGATTWEVVRYVVLPYTKAGVIGGIMLGLGRALGETMAVTFVIGNAYQITGSLMDPGNSIASALANEFAEAQEGLHVSALIELGLILFFITFVVLACAKLLLLRLSKNEGKKT